jgi:branched-chain amino acid transport system substrate-binding protein
MTVACILAIGLVTAAGCGSSSKSSNGSTSTSPPATGATGPGTGSTVAASGSTWVLGSIVTETGAEAPSTGGAGAVLNAWQNWTNTHGGINGHRVKVIVMDDKGDPTVGLADAHQLIQVDHVIALVGTASTPENQWGPYVAQAGVPVIGTGATSGIIWMTNPDFYPVGTAPVAEVYASLLAASKAGKPKMALLYCAESPACAQAVPFTKQIAPSVGVKVVYAASVSTTAPNYSAQCLAAQSAGATSVEVAADQNTVTRTVSDCSRQGVKVTLLGGDGTVSAAWATNPNYAGEVDRQPYVPWNQHNAATADYYAAMAQYAPAELHSPRFGANDIGSWISGQLFAAAAKAANLGDSPTPAQVVTGLTSLHDETLGGLTTPLTFAKGSAHVNKCFFLESIQNKQWTQPYGTQPFCQP